MAQPHQPQTQAQTTPVPTGVAGVCAACGQRCFNVAHANSTASSSSRSDRSDTSNSVTESHRNHLDLLERVFATCDSNVPPHIAQARELADTLGLGQPGAYPGYTWEVASHSHADLAPSRLRLPAKHKHSGNFDWIGSERQAYPQYLWDSSAFVTVEATPERLQNYCAVSWTWGRFQLRNPDGSPKWRRSTTLNWRVPVLPKIESRFFGRPVDRLTHLKHLLRSIKAFRYFWVDVLCIDQGTGAQAEAEKKAEIAKQAQIFQNASASFAYLWTLDERTRHDLSRAVGAFGSLLASCLHFRPGQPFIGATTMPKGSLFPSHDLWKDRNDLFAHLQDDKYFTSLWALQEMVLFPSAIWLTEDGGFATINKRPVTTRLFATAVRLLREMSRLRSEQWNVEEKQYIQRRNIAPSRFFRLRKELSDLEHKRKLALQEGSTKERDQSKDADLCIEMCYAPRTPSVLKHRLADQPLQDEIDRWVNWSCGKAGIDICLGATRAAILVAGSNREVVDSKSKEYALLAALKIGNHSVLIPETILEAQERHFSHNLFNVILQQEGPEIFSVVHESFMPEFKTLSSNLLDTSDWDIVTPFFPYIEDSSFPYIYVEVPKNSEPSKVRRNSDEELAQEWTTITRRNEPVQNEVTYQQNGHDKYVTVPQQQELLLTDMSPWKANCPIYHGSNWDACATRHPEDVADWHMHPTGKVHVPQTARIQDISERHNSTEIKMRFNGGEVEYQIYRSSDLKVVSATQQWLCEKLGKKPRFIFLPLYTYSRSREQSTQARDLVGNYRAMKMVETFGVVLVGKTQARKDQSLTTWYKLGTYCGKGLFTTLGWKDGIIVTSPHEEAQTPRIGFPEDCQKLISESRRVAQSLSDVTTLVEKDYVMISPAELMDVEYARARDALAPD